MDKVEKYSNIEIYVQSYNIKLEEVMITNTLSVIKD